MQDAFNSRGLPAASTGPFGHMNQFAIVAEAEEQR
jgi:hypothetical protein